MSLLTAPAFGAALVLMLGTGLLIGTLFPGIVVATTLGYGVALRIAAIPGLTPSKVGSHGPEALV